MKITRWGALGALLLTAAAPLAQAGDLDQLNRLVQDEFRLLSEDLTGALSYKSVLPAEPLGITGFDAGVEVTASRLQQSSLWQKATGSSMNTLAVPKLHVHKGLPLKFDVGGFYSAVPGSNIKLYGGELRYSLLEGGVAMPAVAVRGTFSRLAGVDQLDFDSRGLELTVSKGFAMFTPYAGVGRVWADSKPNVAGLTEVSLAKSKVFAGTNVNLGLVNLAVEADRTGENTSLSAKVGMRW